MTTTAVWIAGLAARDADFTDAELLDRFVAYRDGPAFSALVTRHGPMVFAICLRMLRQRQDAEDAFQATFLVLARRAADVSPSGAVAGWLHGVAYRVAKGARRTQNRRSQRERTTDDLPDPEAPPGPTADADLRGLIDDELRRLPAKYRELLVACDLEGQARQPVAQSLGIPEGTLSSRLTTARKMLASRLVRRGVAPVVATGVAASGPSVVACEVPRAVLAAAARFGFGFPGTVPAGVATLAHGVIRAMTVRNYLPWITALLVAACAAIGVAASLPQSKSPTPPKTVAARPAPAKPLPQGPNKIVYCRGQHLNLIDPDGKNEKELVKAGVHLDSEDYCLSPDGKWVAVSYSEKADGSAKTIRIRELGTDGPWTDVGSGSRVFWSGDGTELLVAVAPDGPPAQSRKRTHHLINLATKARTDLNLPAGHDLSDWSRDGTFFLTTQVVAHDDGKGNRTTTVRHCILNRDGTERTALADEQRQRGAGYLSPDGKRVLFLEGPDHNKLTVVDMVTGKATPVEGIPPTADQVFSYCWSPDGKKIAYTWRTRPDAGENESSLVVCDPDGKHAKTVATEKTSANAIGGVHWR